MEVFTVAFFGHRDFNAHSLCEEKLESLIRDLLRNKEYVEFLVGRNGEFDIFAASSVVRVKRRGFDDNSSLTLVLPYPTAEYINNRKYFEEYYDEVEICEKASMAHYKAAMGVRNKIMVDRADLVILYVERKSGGAYRALKYAEETEKKLVNLADLIKCEL